MRPSLSRRFALLLTGLGLSAALAAAGPPPEDKGTSKSTPPAKSRKVDPMPPAKSGKPDPMPPSAPSKPATIVPKGDPKPILLPKDDPKPLPLPKVEPKLPPKVEPKLPPLPSKLEPKPLPPASKVDPKPPVDLPPIVKPPVDTTKPSPSKVTPLPTVPTIPEAKLPAKPTTRPIVIHEKPKGTDPTEKPTGPGLKLPAGTKVDQAELAKIKPPVDLTKTKPEAVLAAKPPADFKVKPIKLDQIQVPKNATTVNQLNVTNVTTKQTFVVNNNYYTGGNYHTKYGTKMAGGLYCYPGKWHSHWHHCIWDPCFQCHYFYCPSMSCYYYWCATDYCYYPCHWFVDYGTCYYPWWICGGFGGYGYVGTPHISIFIGW